ncbi:MAG: hypothetical protein U0103_06400 [Candidatus Obscuribacterales bacterium]
MLVNYKNDFGVIIMPFEEIVSRNEKLHTSDLDKRIDNSDSRSALSSLHLEAFTLLREHQTNAGLDSSSQVTPFLRATAIDVSRMLNDFSLQFGSGGDINRETVTTSDGKDTVNDHGDAQARLQMNDALMRQNAQKIADDLLLGTDESIHRAQMETLELFKMTGFDKGQINQMLTIVYQTLVGVRENPALSEDERAALQNSVGSTIRKFGLINLGNGCTPDGQYGGSFDVTPTDKGFLVTYTDPEGKANTVPYDGSSSDYFRVDSTTGKLVTKYDVSTVESALRKGDWYEAGRELYSLKKHMSDADFNELCSRLSEDAAKAGSELPKISLQHASDGSNNVIAVDLPGGQIYNDGVAHKDPGQSILHPLQAREFSEAE